MRRVAVERTTTMVVVGTTRDAEQGTGEQVLAFRIGRGRKSRRESRRGQAGVESFRGEALGRQM